MSPLKERIIERIEKEGPINFETFMEMTLYYPDLGYYARETTGIGRQGDFYTSPHLHSIFGAMLGRQLEEMWDLMGRPDPFRVVEMGAGRGYMAKDILDYLNARSAQARGGLLESLGYLIVELNPFVKAQQQELLAEFSEKVGWCSALKEVAPAQGCFLSNELLDAFPVKIVEMDGGLREVCVAAEGERLVEVKRACSPEVSEYFREFGLVLPEGYRTEVNLRMRDWIGQVSDRLSGGFVLTVDYGYPAWDYYGEDRNRGTLLCYFRHQVREDPYTHVGEQDLTAHVNFTALGKWGEAAGLQTLGFCPQGTYLVSLGIHEVMTELYGESPDAFDTAKIKGLVFPEGMGESHKVMIQYKGAGRPVLRGFALRNQQRNL